MKLENGAVVLTAAISHRFADFQRQRPGLGQARQRC